MIYVEVAIFMFFFFQAEDGIRDLTVTGVQTCALPISGTSPRAGRAAKCASPRKTNCRTRWSRSWRWPPPSEASCAGRRFGHGPPSQRPARHLACQAAEAMGDQFKGAEMHGLAQGIAHLQKTDDLVGESLDHGDLEPEPKIPHLGAERLAFVEQDLGSRRKRMQ